MDCLVYGTLYLVYGTLDSTQLDFLEHLLNVLMHV